MDIRNRLHCQPRSKAKTITKKQYLKALIVVEQYNRQLHKPVVSGSFTIEDLNIMSVSIQVPKLKVGLVDEAFASNLQEKLEIMGLKVDWVSLDDMGFISITFRDSNMTDEKIKATLSALNDS